MSEIWVDNTTLIVGACFLAAVLIFAVIGIVRDKRKEQDRRRDERWNGTGGFSS